MKVATLFIVLCIMTDHQKDSLKTNTTPGMNTPLEFSAHKVQMSPIESNKIFYTSPTQIEDLLNYFARQLQQLLLESFNKCQHMLKQMNNVITIMKDMIDNIKVRVIESGMSLTFYPMLSRAIQFFYSEIQNSAKQAVKPFTDQTALCKTLRYYIGARRDSRVPQQLSFRDGAGAVAEMRSQAARIRSFGTSMTVELARSMASAGLFLTADGQVRCAFCQGKLSWNVSDGVSVMQAHAIQFSTCPFVLRMDVGNETMDDKEADRAQHSTQCSEAEESTAQASASASEHSMEQELRSLAMSDQSGRQRRQASASELLVSSSSLSLPRASTLRSVMESRAVQGLEMLERVAAQLPIEHPNFIGQRDRLETLEGVELGEPADQVASAGFFSDQSETIQNLVCFWCDLRLPATGIQLLGNAWTAHAVWSPRCGHLLSERGASFVRSARAFGGAEFIARFVEFSSSSPHPQSAPQQPLHRARLSSNLGIRYRVESREFRARTDTPAAQNVVQLGFSTAEVRVAIELRLMTTGDDFATSEVLLTAVVVQRDTMTWRSEDVESFRENYLLRLQGSVCSSEPQESPETDWRTCKVCMDRQINVLLLDCGHLCCCSRCSVSLQTCPICRKGVRAEAPVKFV